VLLISDLPLIIAGSTKLIGLSTWLSSATGEGVVEELVDCPGASGRIGHISGSVFVRTCK
jgi:hypothetical protein